MAPAADGAEAKLLGVRELHRRFTSVYLRERARWHLIAPDANVTPDDPKAGR